MKNDTKQAIALIRESLGLRRIDPRRLYMINDGADSWIGDRGKLDDSDASALRAIHSVGSRPDLATSDELEEADEADYDSICNRVGCLAASHGSAGVCDFFDLPDDWQDGSALGPISPLRGAK